MQNTCKSSIFCALIYFSGIAHTSLAQATYTITDSKSNSMKLSGTSSLHDWEMSASSFAGNGQFVIKDGETKELTALNALSFTLPVRNLKSDKSALDNNAYKALKAGKYENIVYKLSSASVVPDKEGNHLVKTRGKLTIADVTKEVAMDVHCFLNNDLTIRCTGSDKLKMTDYGVKPPTFLLGAMTTGDAVTLNFTMVFKQ